MLINSYLKFVILSIPMVSLMAIVNLRPFHRWKLILGQEIKPFFNSIVFHQPTQAELDGKLISGF